MPNRSDSFASGNNLYQHLNEKQTAYLYAFLILTGDFNHAYPKSMFPKTHEHIDFPT